MKRDKIVTRLYIETILAIDLIPSYSFTLFNPCGSGHADSRTQSEVPIEYSKRDYSSGDPLSGVSRLFNPSKVKKSNFDSLKQASLQHIDAAGDSVGHDPASGRSAGLFHVDPENTYGDPDPTAEEIRISAIQRRLEENAGKLSVQIRSFFNIPGHI